MDRRIALNRIRLSLFRRAARGTQELQRYALIWLRASAYGKSLISLQRQCGTNFLLTSSQNCVGFCTMNETDIRNRLWKECDKFGQVEVAEKIGISQSYLSDFLHGRRKAGKAIQKYLGIERRVTYHKTATNGASNGR